jgi:hypothetical protein
MTIALLAQQVHRPHRFVEERYLLFQVRLPFAYLCRFLPFFCLSDRSLRLMQVRRIRGPEREI